jgi:hypothetical protein
MGSGTMRGLASPTWRVMLLSDGSVTRHLQVRLRRNPTTHRFLQGTFGAVQTPSRARSC